MHPLSMRIACFGSHVTVTHQWVASKKKKIVCWDPFGNLIFKQHVVYVSDLCPGGSPIARWPFVAAKDSPSDKLWSELGSFNFARSLARKNMENATNSRGFQRRKMWICSWCCSLRWLIMTPIIGDGLW